MDDTRSAAAEGERHAGDLVRQAVVETVDLAAGLCTASAGELLSGPIPWFERRAGDTRTWSPPTVGEQGVLICPEGDIAAGFLLLGVFSNNFPAPGDSLREVVQFKDGAVVAYDPEAHKLDAVLPGGGTVDITADQTTIHGKLHVTGLVTSGEDVKVGSISLKNHKHGGVQAGSAKTAVPE